MTTRADRGAIFENFFVVERMKKGVLEIFPPEIMFWRTRSGFEIDVIEKNGVDIFAYECTWKEKARLRRVHSKLPILMLISNLLRQKMF